MRVTVVTVLLAAFAGFSAAQNAAPPSTVDVKAAAKQIVADVRQLVEQARGGIVVDQLYQGVLALEGKASDLILLLSQPVPECETKAVIKMAARGTGSHEVLTVMLAEDTMSVLNGRLALSLAFLEQVAMQMEDELSLSDDVGGHLSAIVFGANTTANIVETADKTVKQLLVQPKNRHLRNRLRRAEATQPTSSGSSSSSGLDLGSGWSLGGSGLNWASSSGATRFNLSPTFSGGLGAQGSLTHTMGGTPWGSPGSTQLQLGGGTANGGSVRLGLKISF